MPLCTAVLAAALLSGAPADPAPMAGEPMAPGKQIAALAMNHPEEPDFVASKALEILNKGANVGPFFSPDDADDEAANGPMAGGPVMNNGPMANGRAAGGPMPAGQAPAGGPMPGAQANGAQPGFMFTMPATSRNANANAGGRAPQDIFLHPPTNQPTYAKLSGEDFARTRTPSSRQTDDSDAHAGAWARPFMMGAMQGSPLGAMQGGAAQKAGKPKAAGVAAKPKTGGGFWQMPGWD